VEQDQHAGRSEEAGQGASARAAKSQPSLPLAAYDGEYEDAWYGKVVIREGASISCVLRARRT
jgi:hypothetical protein